MAEEIKRLQPEAVWRYFYDLTQIPRPTGQTKEVVAYAKSVGERLGLETKVDKVGNVLIRKPASVGYEQRTSVVLQAHLDMVPQKNSHVQHNFATDPIDAHIDGEWVRARETTLGADNGIGAAMGFAVLEAKELKHGPLEVLFTIDEEVGMVGANALEAGFVQAKTLLNLDSELVGELYIGCAGGIDINVSLEYQAGLPTPEGDVALWVKLSGLKGGHSGVDIHLGRGNANKLLFRFLKKAVAEFNLSIAELTGGSLRNAIPREAEVLVTLPADEVSEFEALVAEFEALYNKEYKGIENRIELRCEKASAQPSTVVPEELTDNIIHAVEACQNGVITYLTDFPDTVESSSNLASVQLKDGLFKATFLTRSSSESRKEMVASSIESAFTLIGARVEFDASYNGWQPDAHSHVLEVMRKVATQVFGREPAVKVMHAGLECGILQGVMPDTEMISFGPTILHPHSPDEKVEIATVESTWKLLVATLEAL